MAIVSNEDYVSGEPRIEGTRIWVSHVVCGVEYWELDGYLDSFPHLDRKQVQEALEYCKDQECSDSVVKYCQGCTKDDSPPIEDDPEAGVHVLGEVSLPQVLAEWDPTGKVLVLGNEEDINEKRDLWKVAERLHRANFEDKR